MNGDQSRGGGEKTKTANSFCSTPRASTSRARRLGSSGADQIFFPIIYITFELQVKAYKKKIKHSKFEVNLNANVSS